ncbi:MAG: hypothetical protein J7L63_04405 [Thermoplasmata archaeon]|nr:hypothetical protein [Thermoplasmata archaeon]
MIRWLWYLSLVLLAIGVIFYISWAFLYDAWTDIGLYSISAPLIIFGILGALLSRSQ